MLADAAAGWGARVSNGMMGPDYMGFCHEGLPLALVRDNARTASQPAPKNDKNTELYLSYHILGFCWENCCCKKDHKVHSVQERTTLTHWCKECY
jgi:hypothetical protein